MSDGEWQWVDNPCGYLSISCRSKHSLEGAGDEYEDDVIDPRLLAIGAMITMLPFRRTELNGVDNKGLFWEVHVVRGLDLRADTKMEPRLAVHLFGTKSKFSCHAL